MTCPISWCNGGITCVIPTIHKLSPLSSATSSRRLQKQGIFFHGLVAMSNDDIDRRLKVQCDDRPFMTLKGVLPFPEKQPLTEKLEKEKLAKKQKK